MKAQYFILLTLIGACTGSTNSSTLIDDDTEHRKEEPLLLVASDTSHLVFGVLKTLEIDSSSFQEELSVTLEAVTIDCHFAQDAGYLNHASLVYNASTKEDYGKVIKGINAHFNASDAIKSESKSFTTWVLRHKGNPIIEVTLFPHPDDNKAELLFNIRQYI